MPKVTFIEADGREFSSEMDVGASVMEAAMKAGTPGIHADCGGACACATCHVYIPAEWQDAVGGPNEMEEAMLECADDVRRNSRLSCQIRLTHTLDGLVVEVPASQG